MFMSRDAFRADGTSESRYVDDMGYSVRSAGSPGAMRPLDSPTTSGTYAAPVRPVSARSWRAAATPASPTSPVSATPVTMYQNDLFGAEDHGDVLAGEAHDIRPSTPKPTLNIVTSRPTTPSHRMQQQMALSQQKRLQRLQGGIAVSSDSPVRSRPGTPTGGSNPGSLYGSPHSGAPSPAATKPSQPAGALKPTSLVKEFQRTGGIVELQEQPRQAKNIKHSPSPTKAAEQTLRAHGLAAAYDPTEEVEKPQPKVTGTMLNLVASAAMQDTSDVRSFAMQPGPMERPVQCYIIRDKSSKMYPRYSLFLDGSQRFLLAARKRKKSKSANYLISLDKDDLGRDSAQYAGKVRANFVGTEFVVYDKGCKPGHQPADGGDLRAELAGVRYQYNVLGTRGPRKMTVLVPTVDTKTGQRYSFRPLDESESILERHKRMELDKLVIMKNKAPKWNEQLGAYCLNFNGRVTHASVKNFQLVSDDNPDHVILQFGKIGKDSFTMDYAHPISALQAFAICLTSFDNKLACE
ncbi:hypothetical protein WJX72_002064 [[Myrmecia] bisecta]|uniref:Tubby C-terminal domain-containing protein n=1 Tax=[Myrmecia] bisecta TaxID=41462 RepID=A0AAW1QAA2_9CHLO